MPDITIVLEEKRKLYKSIVSVFCPILSDTVYFTSEGFNHLLYKRHNVPRSIPEKYMKLLCLEHVVEVVSKSTRISEARVVRRKIKNVWKETVCYELVYEVSPKKKVRVIIEKIGTGKFRFRSIMPHDKRSKTKKRP